MKLFLDSANLEEITDLQATGLLDGVTTNPTLMKKEFGEKAAKGQVHQHTQKIIELVDGPVSLEVASLDAEAMVAEGKFLFATFGKKGNVVIKIPISTYNKELGELRYFEGVKAIQALRKEKIPVNCTLIMSPEQAVMAMKAGATYVSPFMGRVNDELYRQLGLEVKKGEHVNQTILEISAQHKEQEVYGGARLLQEIVHVLQGQKRTEVLASSIRNRHDLRAALLAGADIATMPYSVFTEAITHPLTIAGIKSFTEDAQKASKLYFTK